MTDFDVRIRHLIDATAPVTLAEIRDPAERRRRRAGGGDGTRRQRHAVSAFVLVLLFGSVGLTIGLVGAGVTGKPAGSNPTSSSLPVTANSSSITRNGLTVEVTLDTRTAPLDGVIHGALTVVNRGPTLRRRASVCGGQIYQVDLVTPAFRGPSVILMFCPGTFRLVHGVSRFPIELVASQEGTWPARLFFLGLTSWKLPVPPAIAVTVTRRAPPPTTTKVTIRLVLAHTRVVAGTTIHGQLIVTNHTGAALEIPECPFQAYDVGLTNGREELLPAVASVKCSGFSLRAGASRVRVGIVTTYISCTESGGSGAPGEPACLADGASPPLPAGRYRTLVVLSGFPAGTEAPAPIAITLLPAK